MKTLTLAAVSLATLLIASGGAMTATAQSTARPTPPTIEQMSAFPRISGFTISPDGRHIAALEPRGDEQVILVWDTANPQRQPTVIGSTQMRIRSVSFLKNEVLGVSLWQPYDYNDGMVVKTFINKFMITDLEGRNWRDPITVLRGNSREERAEARMYSPSVLDRLPNDPDNILLSIGSEVYRLNVRTNRSERIQREGERTVGYDTDLTGALRTREIINRDGTGLYVATQFRNSTGGWDEHQRNYVRDRDVFSVAGFSADPNIAYVISNRGRDKAAIFEYDIAARRMGEVAFEHPFFEATGVSVDRRPGPNFGQVIGFSYHGPRASFYPVAPEYVALQRGVETALDIQQTPLRIVDPATGESRTIRYDTDRFVEIRAVSSDMNTAVVWAGGVNDPGQYYLLRNQTELFPLGREYPQVDPASLGTTRLDYYQARDGLTIPTFVSTPPQAQYGPGPYPTVIMPHGGPWSRDDLDWDGSWWRQLLTSRGYAVIQPQFRGSDGWGRRLWTAGDNEWGQKMQDDLDDSVRWAISQNVAIEGRVAMYGYSYGGYAAMAAGVRPNGLYKCAIAGAGVSDLTRIRSSLFQNPYVREAQRDTVTGLSPSRQANAIQIPMMVFHGERDTTVDLEQSDIFVRAARASGQQVDYHVLADYGHGPAWSRATLGQVLSHLETYLQTGCGGSGL